MPDISFELKDRIHQLMEDKHISPGKRGYWMCFS